MNKNDFIDKITYDFAVEHMKSFKFGAKAAEDIDDKMISDYFICINTFHDKVQNHIDELHI